MKKPVKKLLALMLIISLAILPLRVGFSMSMANSGNYCKDAGITMVKAGNEKQTMEVSISDNQFTPSISGNYGDPCEDSCTSCMNSAVAIEPGMVKISSHFVRIDHAITLTAINSRTLTPHFKPPITFYI